VFDHLFEERKPEREAEIERPKSINQKSANLKHNNNNNDFFTGREVRTSQLVNLDILLWIMIFLILFLLIILVYLLFLLCRDRRYTSNNNKSKSGPSIKNGQPVNKPVRVKKRKIRQIRHANKVIDGTEHKENEHHLVTVALDKSKNKPGPQTEFEVREESYASSPNMVTYYQYTRLQYPKLADTTNTVNVFEPDSHAAKVEQVLEPMQHNLPNGQNQLTLDDPIELHQQQDELDDSHRNIQRKSIFAITYDKIHSRENISAGSK